MRIRESGAATQHERAPRRLSLDDRHKIFFAHDEQFLAIHLDLGAGVLAEQHLVAGLDTHRAHLAVFLDLAGAHGDHFALDRLLGRGIWDDDAAGGFGFRLQALDDHAVVQRTKLHGLTPPCLSEEKTPLPSPWTVSTRTQRVPIVGATPGCGKPAGATNPTADRGG